jgi:hypothetical protein
MSRIIFLAICFHSDRFSKSRPRNRAMTLPYGDHHKEEKWDPNAFRMSKV